MEAWPIAQSSLQKLNFDNTGQKNTKLDMNLFKLMSCLIFERLSF